MATEAKTATTAVSISNGTQAEWVIAGAGGSVEPADSSSGNSQILRLSGFGFSLADCVANGVDAIQVSVNRDGTDAIGNFPLDLTIQLRPGGATDGDNKAGENGNNEWTGPAVAVYGDLTSDMWGGVSTDAADYTSASFAVDIQVTGDGVATVIDVEVEILYEATAYEPAELTWDSEAKCSSITPAKKRLVAVK